MTTRHWLIGAAVWLPLAALVPAAGVMPAMGLAQSADAPELPAETDDLDATVRTMSVYSMFELEVVTADGDRLGEVWDVIADPTDGLLKFLVVERGGNLLGFMETRAAIPWHQVSITRGERQFVLDMTAEEVELLPNWEGERTTGASVSAAPATERPDVETPAEAN